MGKNHRHQKNLKSEKAKVKLKTKKTTGKPLPKGLNITNTSFKAKKIVIGDQLKQHDDTEILSHKKLNVKDLLTRIQHHNSTVRQDAIRQLKEILAQNSSEIIAPHRRVLIQGIAALSLDKERDIRRDSLKILNSILSPMSNDQARSYFDILISYLGCSMTHIDPNIKEDSLLFLDILVQNCGALVAKKSRKILPNFLNMISRLCNDTQPGRQLVTTLNSKSTSVKWRTKVLSRLSSIFASIVSEIKFKVKKKKSIGRVVIYDPENPYIPLYKNYNREIWESDFEVPENSLTEIEELIKHAKVLMPLMFDSWIEVIPKTSETTVAGDRVISAEASTLLQSIAKVIQLLVEYFELLEMDSRTVNNTGDLLRENFLDPLRKNMMDKFPYSQSVQTDKIRKRKRQEDFDNVEYIDKCLEQNLSLCYAYVWILTNQRSNEIDKASKDVCRRIFDYVNETLRHWSSSEASSIPHLTRLLRVIFHRGSKIFYKSGLSLGETIRAVNEAHGRASRELQSQFLAILSDIVVDRELDELRKEEAFRQLINTLPSYLLKNSINDSTIVMLNQITLRYPHWIRDELTKNQAAMIENATNITIIGSEDDTTSRLMFCNLFRIVDGRHYEKRLEIT